MAGEDQLETVVGGKRETRMGEVVLLIIGASQRERDQLIKRKRL